LGLHLEFTFEVYVVWGSSFNLVVISLTCLRFLIIGLVIDLVVDPTYIRPCVGYVVYLCIHRLNVASLTA